MKILARQKKNFNYITSITIITEISLFKQNYNSTYSLTIRVGIYLIISLDAYHPGTLRQPVVVWWGGGTRSFGKIKGLQETIKLFPEKVLRESEENIGLTPFIHINLGLKPLTKQALPKFL